MATRVNQEKKAETWQKFNIGTFMFVKSKSSVAYVYKTCPRILWVL